MYLGSKYFLHDEIPTINNRRKAARVIFCDLKINFGKEAELEEMKKVKRDLSQTAYNNGLAYFQSEKLNEAKDEYKKAYFLDCYNGDALYNLGITYFRLDQKDSACVSWKELKVNFGRTDADNLIKKYCSN